MRVITLIFILFSVCTSSAVAIKAGIKIDIDGRKSKIDLKSAKISGVLRGKYPSWLKGEEKNRYLIFSSRQISKDWKRFKIAFYPQESGTIKFCVRGAYQNRKSAEIRYTDYRNFIISGAELKNSDLKLENSGRFEYWNGQQRSFVISKDGNYIQGHHDFAVYQYIKVTKNKLVTVEFEVRSGKSGQRISKAKKKPPVRYAAGENHPASYYRLYEERVKYLPLKDKGIKGKSIVIKSPHLKRKRPLPEAVFVNKGFAGESSGLDSLSVNIELLEEAGVARNCQVRFGMPWAEGKLYNTSKLFVKDPSGRAIPAQFSILSRYPDKSIKWLLIQFAASMKAHEKCLYTLKYGSKNKSQKTLLLKSSKEYYTIDTGKIKAKISKRNFNWLKDVYYDRNSNGIYEKDELVGSFAPEGMVVRDEHKKILTSSVIKPQIKIEESGPLVITLCVAGKYGKESKNALSYETRLRFFANSPMVAVEHTHFDTDLENEFKDITDLSIKFFPRAKIKNASTIVKEQLVDIKHIRQDNDEKLTCNNDTLLSRMTGSIRAKLADNTQLSLSVRDAALRYPKAFRVDKDSLSIDLLPEQPDEKYNNDLAHYLVFPFCSGKYRMKWGMSFTENILFDFSGEMSMKQLQAENDKYVIAVVDKDYLASTKVIPGVLPKDDKRFQEWDKVVFDGLSAVLEEKKRQREYGFLNYGDWFGERGRNWGNNEYDLPRSLFYYFARTGDRRAYRLAMLGASHQADVDIIHAYPDRYYVGTNAEHSIGHTGVNYQQFKRATWSFPCQVSFEAKNGHTWTGGMVSAWTFGGNARIMNSALKLGEHTINFMLPNYTRLSSHERSAGWSLKALMELYKVTYDPAYLKAGKKMVDIAMKEQKFDKGGAWPHRLPKDHSGGNKDAFGNVPFLIATLLEGLSQYYRYKPSAKLKRSIVSGGMWQKRAWQKDLLGWPYTLSWDCKPYFHTASCGLLVAPSLIYAANLADDAEAYKICEATLKLACFSGPRVQGKSFSFDMCLNAELLQGIIDWNNNHKDSKPFRYDPIEVVKMLSSESGRDFRLRAPEHKKVLVQLSVPQTELLLIRKKHGSRPLCKPEGKIVLQSASGKKLFEKSFKTASSCEINIPVKGKAGDCLDLIISDDMTGKWNVKSRGARIFAKMESSSSLGGVKMGAYYFTVPKGCRNFSLKIDGVHSGKFGGMIINAKGKVVERLDGFNYGKCRLPWVKYNKTKDYKKSIDLKLPYAAVENELWQVLLWAAGDLKIEFKGIPSYLTVKPDLLPVNKLH